MSSDLLFDFTVDKAAKTVLITREFDAELSLVWDAYTKPEILDQWWAPKPYTSKTKFMNFEVGGRRFYAMVSPEGEESWSTQDYTSISPTTNFKYFDAFADKDGLIKTDFPSGDWDLDFSELDGRTKVKINIIFKTLANLEHLMQMGFKEGFTMTLKELEIILSTIKKEKNEQRFAI